MLLILTALLAQAEMWGGTNEGLSADATLIAVASASNGVWEAVRVVRGDLGRMPRESMVADGEYLVICDDLMCPRAVGRAVEGGWVVHGREMMNGAVLSPGLVASGEESTLGIGTGCLRTSSLYERSWVGVMDRSGELNGGTSAGRLSVWSYEGARLDVQLGSIRLGLLGSASYEADCWNLAIESTQPPLRDAADLAHFEQSKRPLLWGRGELVRDGEAVPAAFWMDGYGQLMLELDGEAPLTPHGARSIPRAGGTRWMFKLGEDEIIEVAVPPRDRRAGAKAVAGHLEDGPRSFDVFLGDGTTAIGTLTLTEPSQTAP